MNHSNPHFYGELMSLIRNLFARLAPLLAVGAVASLLTAGTAALAQAPASATSAALAVSTEAAPNVVAPAKPAGVPLQDIEKVDNPYGLDALWKTGDAIAKGTLVILVIMSMATWYVLFTKLFEQSQLLRQARQVGEDFWRVPSVQKAAASLSDGSAFRVIADSGLKATDRHEGLLDHIDLNTWVAQGIERATGNVRSRLRGGLSILATVGSTAPFIGLFGTVWGIYHALVSIGLSGQASIDKVAGPVGEALIMTAIGLAVAVPAVLGYNWLVSRNKTCMESVGAFGSDLHSVLLGSAVKK
jgi:biopolymer transport protein ExbB